LSLHINYY